ncbi:type II and III secretion system protein family protein [Sphingomonas piscis]|uniref:Type II and III secretion system protein family protein n=1 Tax=Sphingomonas piscis TaxID=2714943 RepID=A0A6G7YLX7_9SPHN|nr:type II and III secretion system protein family protein [Sphingomonas piscis]QIK77716.1 type II and III secretion system protein family protein [Sphingomonas piscis]
MKTLTILNRARLGTAAIALATALGAVGPVAPATAQSTTAKPAETLNLSQGAGTLVRLSEPMTDVFVANDGVADVQVKSSTQLYVFGKGRGETTIYATTKSGRTIYAATVRVGNNLGSVDEMLRLAMPEADVRVTPMNNLLLLTGTVASPDDVAEAQRLVQAYIGEGTQIVSRIKSATPLQVMLKVRIAEVSRSALKNIGVNILNRDTASQNGTLMGIGRGDPGTINVVKGPADPVTGVQPETVIGATFKNLTGGTTLGIFRHMFGMDILGTLDLLQTDGFATTLAEPSLSALSGETASFLAGGEFPIPVSQGNDAISIEYKQYGVGLAFTPFVLADGRISMRVRPEVSEISDANSVRLNGFVVPAMTTRRAETTVELGSGQSFMLAGLLQNRNSNSIERAPFLGDLPILGALFRSSGYRRSETELVIVVTPYLVRPVSGQLALPTDGYRNPTDPELMLEGKLYQGKSGAALPANAPAPGLSGAAASTAAPGFKL